MLHETIILKEILGEWGWSISAQIRPFVGEECHRILPKLLIVRRMSELGNSLPIVQQNLKEEVVLDLGCLVYLCTRNLIPAKWQELPIGSQILFPATVLRNPSGRLVYPGTSFQGGRWLKACKEIDTPPTKFDYFASYPALALPSSGFSLYKKTTTR